MLLDYVLLYKTSGVIQVEEVTNVPLSERLFSDTVTELNDP